MPIMLSKTSSLASFINQPCAMNADKSDSRHARALFLHYLIQLNLSRLNCAQCMASFSLFNLSNLQLPFGWGLSIGDIWLNKTRNFTVGWYPALPTPIPPPPPSPPPSAPAPTDTPSPSPSPSETPSETASPSPTPTPACARPVGNFTADKTVGTSPLTVQFTDLESRNTSASAIGGTSVS